MLCLGFLVTLEMVPWKFWTVPPGYPGAAGNSSCGTEFRVMLNSAKGELINSRIPRGNARLEGGLHSKDPSSHFSC